MTARLAAWLHLTPRPLTAPDDVQAWRAVNWPAPVGEAS